MGAVLQDFRDGRRSALLDVGSALLPTGGGSSASALAPNLILETPELCSAQLGQPPDDLLYHPPPSLLGHSDNMMTLAIYTHATDGMQDSATAAFEEAFS